MKRLYLILIPFLFLAILFRLFFGIFVIHPMGAIPEGTSIVYFRTGLNLPFIASAEGILDNSGEGVSLLGRGILLGTLAEPILENEIFRFGYSEMLYLLSTGGKEYN